MTSLCSGERLFSAARTSSSRFFFSSMTSGLSAGSATVASIVSSSSASLRMRRAESALKRATASNQVETDSGPGTGRPGADVKEHVAQEVLGHGFVADEAQQPAVDRGAMAGKQRLHRQPIASGNARNQRLIGGVFPGRTSRHGGGGSRRVNAIDMEFPLKSRPAQSSRQGKIGSQNYFSGRPGTILTVPGEIPCPDGLKSRPSVVSGGA